MSGAPRDFYKIQHGGVILTLPRVTSILKVIDKSGPLMGWAVNQERAAFRLALEDALTLPGELNAQAVYDRVATVLTGRRAFVRAQEDAANIGLAAHRLIEWHIRRMLGEPDMEAEPSDIPEAATCAVLAWMDWCRAVDFTPLHAERVVYCPSCAFAGTLDVIAKISGVVTCADWKTGKAVYPEAFLQNIAYRHCAAREGIATEAGLILRLPKTASDPAFEAVPVPAMPYGYFLSASRLWRWQRMMDGAETGQAMTRCELERSGVTVTSPE